MYAEIPKTMASLMRRPVFQKRDLSALPMVELKKMMDKYGKAKGTDTNIETATTLYYLSNHGFHLIEGRFGREAKLPDPVYKLAADHVGRLNDESLRMFYYLMTISAEEAAFGHAKNDGLFDFIETNTSVDAAKWARSLIGRDHGGRAGLFSKVGSATAGECIKATEMIFRFAQWNGGYGGLPWAQIAETAGEVIRGQNSLDLMVDKAFTLCHNNGAIFNKGHFYTHYCSQYYTILDVQASGQIPNAVHSKHSAPGFSSSAVTAVHKEFSALFKEEFQQPLDMSKITSMEKVRKAKEAKAQKAASAFIASGGGFGAGAAPAGPPKRPCDDLFTEDSYLDSLKPGKMGFR